MISRFELFGRMFGLAIVVGYWTLHSSFLLSQHMGGLFCFSVVSSSFHLFQLSFGASSKCFHHFRLRACVLGCYLVLVTDAHQEL